jgi:hypothetical protein
LREFPIHFPRGFDQHSFTSVTVFAYSIVLKPRFQGAPAAVRRPRIAIHENAVSGWRAVIAALSPCAFWRAQRFSLMKACALTLALWRCETVLDEIHAACAALANIRTAAPCRRIRRRLRPPVGAQLSVTAPAAWLGS